MRWLVTQAWLLCFLGLALNSSAAYFFATDKYTLQTTQQLAEDAYIAAEDIRINGICMQDAFLAASKVSMYGRVIADLNVAALDCELNGEIGDDARVIGRELNFAARVFGTAMLCGKKIYFKDTAFVNQGCEILAEEVFFSGRAMGGARISGKSVFINGAVFSDLTVNAERIVLGPRARILGSVYYTSKNPIKQESSAFVQGAVYRSQNPPSETGLEGRARNWTQQAQNWGALAKFSYRTSLFVVLLFLGICLLWAWPEASRRYALAMKKQFVPTLLWGLLLGVMSFVGVLMLALIFIITIIGIPLALFLIMGYILMLVLGPLGMGYMIGMELFKPRLDLKSRSIVALVVGYALVSLLTVVPLVGGLLSGIMSLMGFGALLTMRRIAAVPKPEQSISEPQQPAIEAEFAPAEVSVPVPEKAPNKPPAVEHESAKNEWVPTEPAFRRKQTDLDKNKVDKIKPHRKKNDEKPAVTGSRKKSGVKSFKNNVISRAAKKPLASSKKKSK
jgi:cytoskeletal protein CcmA (bactofilin family)